MQITCCTLGKRISVWTCISVLNLCFWKSLPTGKILHAFWLSADFFYKINFFEKLFQEYHLSVKNSLDPDQADNLSGLVWVQIVCKDQQMTLVGKELLFCYLSPDLFQLPSDLPIEWNKRLLRTAGYCVYKRNPKNSEDRSVRIELSTKVCDSTGTCMLLKQNQGKQNCPWWSLNCCPLEN